MALEIYTHIEVTWSTRVMRAQAHPGSNVEVISLTENLLAADIQLGGFCLVATLRNHGVGACPHDVLH